MRRRVNGLVLAVGLLIAFLVLFLLLKQTQPLTSGSPLPPGKITPQLVSAWDAAFLLAPDGSLWAWGGTETRFTELFGTTNTSKVPQRVGSENDWTKVAANAHHMLALKSDGTLWSWGKWPGETNGANAVSQSPVLVNSDKDWMDIAVGITHGMALKRDGSLWTWGRNQYGQLGSGQTNRSETPLPIDGKWRALAAGAFNSYALHENGTLWGWGLDSIIGARGTNDLSPRQVDPGTNWSVISASSYGLLALQVDGSLWLRGQNAKWTAPAYVTNRVYPFTRIGTDSDWKRIYCGEQYFMAAKLDGTWWVCGQNNSGQLGLGAHRKEVSIDAPTPLPYRFEPSAVALASDHGATLALLPDGTLWTWGRRLGEPRAPAQLNGFKRVANKFLRLIPGKPTFSSRQIDSTPRKLWQLPPVRNEVTVLLFPTNEVAK